MARYMDEYEHRFGESYRRGHEGHSPGNGQASYRRRSGGYAAEFGRSPGYGAGHESDYDDELRRAARRARLPHKPAHGFPVRGIHTYDLDYGSTGGPTTEYSGRMGYPTLPPRPTPDGELPRRGPYTPTLDESYRERTLYGGVSPRYRARGERRLRRQRYRGEEG
jgi:hypothetical protein